MRRSFRIVMFVIGLALVLRGVADLGLYLYGTKTTAQISYAKKNFSGRVSSRTYTAHYNFTLPDKSLRSGSGSVGTRSGREPTGTVKIVYFSSYPDFNSPYGSGQIVYFILWAAAGIFVILYNAGKFKRLLQLEKRARNISHSDNPYRNPSASGGGFSWLLIPVVLLLAVGAYYFYRGAVSDAAAGNTPADEAGTPGNTPGNTINDGMYLPLNNKVFFANWNDNQRLYSMNSDGSGQKPLTKESVSNLNGKDGWIYYTDFNDGDKVYRIREDGSKRSKVYGWKSKYVNMAGDWLYLSNGNDHNKLYRVKIDGSGEKQLNNDESLNVLVAGGWIYYNNKTDDGALYRIRSDGSERTKLMAQSAGSFVIEGDRLYFANLKDGGKLYSMKTDGAEMNLLSQEKPGFLNMDENWFYYSSVDKDGQLYRMKKNGTEHQKLSDMSPFLIGLAGDKLYFIDFWASNKIFEIRKDGSSLKEFKAY